MQCTYNTIQYRVWVHIHYTYNAVCECTYNTIQYRVWVHIQHTYNAGCECTYNTHTLQCVSAHTTHIQYRVWARAWWHQFLPLLWWSPSMNWSNYFMTYAHTIHIQCRVWARAWWHRFLLLSWSSPSTNWSNDLQGRTRGQGHDLTLRRSSESLRRSSESLSRSWETLRRLCHWRDDVSLSFSWTIAGDHPVDWSIWWSSDQIDWSFWWSNWPCRLVILTM